MGQLTTEDYQVPPNSVGFLIELPPQAWPWLLDRLTAVTLAMNLALTTLLCASELPEGNEPCLYLMPREDGLSKWSVKTILDPHGLVKAPKSKAELNGVLYGVLCGVLTFLPVADDEEGGIKA